MKREEVPKYPSIVKRPLKEGKRSYRPHKAAIGRFSPFKKITICMVPDGTNGVRQLKLPRLFSLFLLLFVLSFSAFFIWFLTDYQALKGQLRQFAQLEKIYQLKEKKFILMVKRIERFKSEIGEINGFNRKLKEIVNPETEKELAGPGGVGGMGSIPSDPRHTMAEVHRKQVLSKDRSLGSLEDKIASREQDK